MPCRNTESEISGSIPYIALPGPVNLITDMHKTPFFRETEKRKMY